MEAETLTPVACHGSVCGADVMKTRAKSQPPRREGGQHHLPTHQSRADTALWSFEKHMCTHRCKHTWGNTSFPLVKAQENQLRKPTQTQTHTQLTCHKHDDDTWSTLKWLCTQWKRCAVKETIYQQLLNLVCYNTTVMTQYSNIVKDQQMQHVTPFLIVC